MTTLRDRLPSNWRNSLASLRGIPGLPVCLLLLAAFAIRWYGIDRPLWMDELWSPRLAQLGVRAIWENGWVDQTPPLFYLIQYVTSGFGLIKSEIAWRWVSVLCGVLTVYLLWRTARRMFSASGAWLLALVLLTSSTLVYFSQESRPYAFVILLAALSLGLMSKLLTAQPSNRLWALWLFINLIGIYSSYAYLMVSATQALCLLPRQYRKPAFWIAGVLPAILALPLLPMARASLGNLAAGSAAGPAPSLWLSVQAVLAWDANKFGFSSLHAVNSILILGLALVGVASMLRPPDRRFAVYLAAQVGLPFALYFGVVAPFLNIRIPFYEARQFVPVLPALYLLAAAGFAHLTSRVGTGANASRWLAFACCALLLVVAAWGLWRFWRLPRSAEADAVMEVQRQINVGEPMVSLNAATDRAVGYYLSGARVYLNPRETARDYLFKEVDSDRLFEEQLQAGYTATVAQIRAAPRFWILSRTGTSPEPLAALTAGCDVPVRESYPPYEVMLVRNCVAP